MYIWKSTWDVFNFLKNIVIWIYLTHPILLIFSFIVFNFIVTISYDFNFFYGLIFIYLINQICRFLNLWYLLILLNFLWYCPRSRTFISFLFTRNTILTIFHKYTPILNILILSFGWCKYMIYSTLIWNSIIISQIIISFIICLVYFLIYEFFLFFYLVHSKINKLFIQFFCVFW